METQRDHHQIHHLVQAIRPGGRLRRAWPLTGGASSQVTAFEVELADGSRECLVARCHGSADRTGNINIATDEFALLTILAQAGIPAPRPCFLDASGEMLGAPGVVVEFIAGSTSLTALHEQEIATQMATFLARLHRVNWSAFDLSFLPNLTDRVSRSLQATPSANIASPHETRILAALASCWPLTLTNAPVLLHGDFWPGNVLWRDRRIVGAIDWEDALVGDPVFDLASARLELYWLFGDATMERFTEHYLTTSPVDVRHLAFWELWVALDPLKNLSAWGHAPEQVRDMRTGLDRFIARALDQVGAPPGDAPLITLEPIR